MARTPRVTVQSRAGHLRLSPRALPALPPNKALRLIEVAESSPRRNRLIKTEIDAENRAPEYWIVDLAS